jgi:hypothetical protein
MSETKQKYFVPKVEPAVPLGVPKNATDYEPDLAELGGKDGVIEMKLENSVVMERLAKDIYKDFRSGFRELYANAVSASMLATQLFPNAKPRIEIELNPKTREFTLREFDSIGMSPEVFRDVYTVVGRSGNFEGTRPGQFGFGRLAWVRLSDRMVMETRYRTTDGKKGAFAVEGQNGKAFVVLPKPSLKAFGTSVKLILYDKINLYSLIDYIRKACEFSKIDTFLTLTSEVHLRDHLDDDDDDEDDVFDDDDDDDDNQPDYKAGTMKLNVSYRDKTRKIMKAYGNFHSRVVKEYLLKSDGWEAFCTFIAESSNGIMTLSNIQEERTYILGLPIEADLSLPFNVSLVNILDERKFQPTADRDRLKRESEEVLQREIVAEVRKAFHPIHAASISEYMKLPQDQRLVINAHDELGNGEDTNIGNYLDRETTNFADHLTTYLNYRTKPDSSDRSRTRYSNTSHTTLGNLLATSSSMNEIFIERGRFVKVHKDIIFSQMPNAIIISCFNQPDMMDMLVKAGARLATDYIKTIPQAPKLKIVRTSRTITYTRNGIKHAIDPHTIKVPKGTSIESYKALLKERFKTNCSFAVDKPRVYAGQGVMLDDYIASIAKTQVTTNKGVMTIDSLPKTVSLTRLANINLLPLLEKRKKVIVVDNTKNDDSLFKVALYRTAKKLKYTVDFDGTKTLGDMNLSRYYFEDTADTKLYYEAIKKVVKNKLLANILANGVADSYDDDAPRTLLTKLVKIPEIIDADLVKKLKL